MLAYLEIKIDTFPVKDAAEKKRSKTSCASSEVNAHYYNIKTESTIFRLSQSHVNGQFLSVKIKKRKEHLRHLKVTFIVE